ncbi:O-antigen acetylase [Polaromonas sp. CG9_12]|nr:O-antigen acetylase [Polaromonas sp. CG9_12]
MNQNPSTSSCFRTDINGLRAWAVAAVIFYHFGIPGFSGGFVGVDVFFVISGFLMTGIVVASLERGHFSLLAFYLARARRIMPALMALCVVLLALGWWVLLPVDYAALGVHAVFSLVFLSNIRFWREAGYFDAASHEKWLLHTWSLAVEWQFYLLLPLLLMAVWKWRPGRRPLGMAMAVVLLISLALSVVTTPLRPTAAFYLLPTRAWEMLAGGMACLLAHRGILTARQRNALEAAGLALVIGAMAGFDTASPWPGWHALVPVLGTVAVLLAARSASPWTGHAAAQWLGTRSYSLYLWHWPVMVALGYLEWQTEAPAVAAGLALTLVLGDLSYRLVERPAQMQLGRLRQGWGGAVLLGMALVVMAPVLGIRANDGVAGRFSAAIDMMSAESKNINPRRDECHSDKGGNSSPSCLHGGQHLSAIVIGDSHADAVTTALAAAVASATDGIMQWTYGGCPALPGVSASPAFKEAQATEGYACGEFMDWTMRQLDAVPGNVPVVVVHRLSFYAFGEPDPSKVAVPLVFFSQLHALATPEFLREFTAKVTDMACLMAKDRTVYLVRPIPEMPVDVPKSMSRALLFGQDKDISISLAAYHQRHAFAWAAQDAARDRCGVRILDPLPYLCPQGRCQGARDGRPLYHDDDHLSEYGNKLLVPMFAEVFQSLGGGMPDPHHSRMKNQPGFFR